jgi:hypothetical protein
VIYTEKFFWYVRKNFLRPPPSPVANFSGKKFLDALFYWESTPCPPLPPTFRSFLRPWACSLNTYNISMAIHVDNLTDWELMFPSTINMQELVL